MDSETRRAASEQMLIVNNIFENLDSIRARGSTLTPVLLASVAQSYGDYYLSQGIGLELRENGRLVYPNTGGGQAEVQDRQDGQTIMLSMPLPAPYQDMELTYSRDISGLYAQQQELNRFFVMINWIAGPVLALLLYLLIRRLTKPLKQLSETTRTIAGGDYSNRVELRSRMNSGARGSL